MMDEVSWSQLPTIPVEQFFMLDQIFDIQKVMGPYPTYSSQTD